MPASTFFFTLENIMRVVELTTGGLTEKRTGEHGEDVYHYCLWDHNKVLEKPTDARAIFLQSHGRPPTLNHIDVESSIVADIDLKQTLYRFRDRKHFEDNPNLKKNRMRGR